MQLVQNASGKLSASVRYSSTLEPADVPPVPCQLTEGLRQAYRCSFLPFVLVALCACFVRGWASAYEEQQLKIRGVCLFYLQSWTWKEQFQLGNFGGDSELHPAAVPRGPLWGFCPSHCRERLLLGRGESTDMGVFGAAQQVSIPRALCPLSCLLVCVFFLWEYINWA